MHYWERTYCKRKAAAPPTHQQLLPNLMRESTDSEQYHSLRCAKANLYWLAQKSNTDSAQHSDQATADRKFEQFLESAPDAIVIVDAKGKIVLVNQHTELMFGYSRQELIGEAVEILVPDELRKLHVKERKAYTKESRSRPMGSGIELSAKRKDGHRLPVEISLSPLRFEDQRLITAAIRDVSDRRRAQKALTESERRFREFVEGTDDLFIRLDVDGCFIYTNQTGKRVYGLDPIDLVGRSAFDFVVLEDQAAMKDIFDDCVSGKIKSATLENRQVSISGAIHHILWTVNPQYDELGKVRSVTLIGRDITDRKRLEESQHQRKLQRGIFSNTIVAQEEERKRVARELHDETGQTLTALLLGLGRLLSSQLQAEAKREIEAMQISVVEALKEVRKLATRLRPTALDDLGLLAALEALSEQAEPPKGGKVTFSTGGRERRLEPDVETAVYRVVQEAITNAVKYSDAEKISVEINYSRSHLQATISDDGRGFDPAAVRTGALGLAGMRERADLVGASLTVDSLPGKGTKVTLDVETNNHR